ncbi:hypothetical protein CcaverHIS641_0107580 [Cutaneotrichosporon cavernicola]|nr:hypothetical protein CcaverHIS641_0107580 [Cutaneotrichosporon cavernicola]
MSSPFSGLAMAFPPLPPLPPCPSTSDNALRKSAPPSTYTSTVPSGPTTSRVRPRRSRVSFRDEVDALEEQHRRRPRSHGPPSPLLAPARRPSADAEVAVRKATSVRPALKRSSSSTPLGPSRRASASTGVVASTYDAFDAFRPQTLRYPRVSPALARLSDGGFSIGGADTWSAASNQHKQATIAATTSKLTASPTKSSSSEATTTTHTTAAPKDREPERDNRASVQVTSARVARKPRSPIPSWSSTCPSLSSSSHRASVASTLTAPSMTSLLLSPQSPIDRYLPPMPTYSFGEEGLPGSPMPAKEANQVESAVECEGAPMRLRPRHSEPASFGSSAPSSYIVPRASERLLRLQNSLADLRMQRRASSKENSPTMQRTRPKPLASTGRRDSPRSGSPRPLTPDTPASSDTPSSVRTSIRVSRAPSPTFAELARARPGRERDDNDALADSGDESDLDLSLPPLNAALRSRVIPSSSRLLVKMTQPPGVGATYDKDDRDGLGWSGSESEEEEFSRTVARIARRKSTVPVPRHLSKRPSLPAGYLHRHSDFYSTMASNQTSPSTGSESQIGGPPTPTIGERPSTSLGTSRPNHGTAALLSALVEQKYASRDALPRPKRFVHGWGAPEVLLEDDWPPDNLASDNMSMSDEHMSSTTNVTTPTMTKQAVPAASTRRLPRPLGAAW